MNSARAFPDYKSVAREGERIYAERYQREFESLYADQFAAVDILSGLAFVAAFPEEAIEKARAQMKDAVVHLVRIGAPSAYQVSFMLANHDAGLDRILQG